MSNTVREDDIDVDEVREMMHPDDVQDALGHVEEAEKALVKLRKGYKPGTSPEILRALAMVRASLETALEVDTPCVKCGGTDAPLHTNGRCGYCGRED